ITYFFAMSNGSSGAISGLTFSDILPGGFTYIGGTLQNPFGGSANSYAGTSALTITGLSLPASTQGLISIDVAIPDNENLINNTFFNQASLLNVPSSFGGPQLDSDNPDTGELGDPTPIGIVAPSQGVRGKVFEDVNYGGGNGRDYDAANTSAVNSGFAADLISVEGVRLELYDATGNFVGADTTLIDGSYTFPFLADGSYSVRAVNSTVSSQRPLNSTGLTTIAVQTYRVNGSSGQSQDVVNEVGGASPNLQDDPPNLTNQPLSAITAQSVAPVTLNGEYVENVDFGFNFNTIVNVNDDGQGSLRQFILNSNELANTNLDQEDAPSGVTSVNKPAGTEHSIFMIPASNLVVTNDGGSGTAMNIQPATPLGDVTDINTAIVGETQTAFSGDTNTGVSELSNGPEVVVDYRATIGGAGIAFQGDGFVFGGIGLGRVDGNGITGVGIQITGSGGTVRNSTIFENGNTGVKLDNTADNNIENNVIRSNAVDNTASDGIQLSNVSNTTILSNEIVDNGGYGIDFVIGNNNTITVQSNLIKGNGNSSNTEDAGIGLRNGQDNIISQNTITENSGDGIIIRNNQLGNLISQNSIFANGELGIDLDAGSGNQGDEVTLNDMDDTDDGGNTLLNFPILEAADLNSANNTITLTGFARPGSVIELFLAAPDGSGFGEGQVYLLTLTEGSADDRDATTDTYGPGAVNGLLQGTDNTERFDFQISVPNGVSNGSSLAVAVRY
ncbi:MAG: right-handed parallel beta-helix repeat-containing protein, partial [Calditrichota bacterium]